MTASLPPQHDLSPSTWTDDGPATAAPRVAPDATAITEVFVGRERELATFRAALTGVGNHETTVFLLSGEPGIGKTRLAREVGTIASERGFHVHWGRCWEAGGAPAYWPWIEVVRSCIRAADLTLLAERLTAQAAHLSLLVPELRERFPAVPQPEVTSDPDRARFQLLDGMASFLRAVAAVQPLVIVLDDLHAADHSSVLMLQFLARQLRDVPLVLVGCYRDTEIRAASEIGAALAAVARDGRHVTLQGLPERDVETFMYTLCPRESSPAVVSTVRVVTGGNPLFVGELVRQLATGSGLGGKVPLPDGIRDAVRARLRRLSADGIELLALASVLGQEFALPALATTANLPAERVAATLEEAVAARLVAERVGTLGHYVFIHGLIREVLYEDLSSNRRAEIHGRVGSALERFHGADADVHLATLAHHFFMASTHGDTEKAIAFCTRAADRALQQHAAPEAVEHYGRALQALSFAGGDTSQRRCALLLGRGRALERVGDFEAAHADFTAAATIARQAGDAESLASAALGCGEQWSLKFTCNIIDKSDLRLLEEALRVTPAERHGLRAALLARTGSALFYAGAHARGRESCTAAIEVARRLGDEDVLAKALSARHAVLLGPDGLEERFRVVEEIDRLADASGNREVRLRGQVLRLYNLVQRGDLNEAESEMVGIMRLADEIGDPFERWHSTMTQSVAALFHGRLSDSERLAREAYQAGHRVPGQQRADQNAEQCFLLQTVMVRREQGRLTELSDHAWTMIHGFSQVVVGWRVLVGLLELDLGRTQSAAACVDHIGVRALSMIPVDSVWVGTMFWLAELVARLRDQARCRQLFDLLAPHAELHATIASVVWLGSATRALAILASALERWDEAASLFERALDWHVRRDAPVWLGHTQIDYAEMLLQRRAPGDRAHADRLVAAALTAATTFDAARLAERAAELQRTLAIPSHDARMAAPSPPEPLPTPAAGQAVFRREGEYWTIADGAQTARLKHSRGLTMLAFLLAQPGQEMHALELVLVANPPPPSALPHAAPTDRDNGSVASRREVAAPHLDLHARAAYRERLALLRAELDEARAYNDPSRATRAEAEIEQLTVELKRDLGLGRGRRSGTHAERARLNVTRAIRTALVRIEDAHPLLGEHFRIAVRTGTFCAYVPDPTSRIVWES